MVTTHELRIEIDLQRRVLIVQVREGCAAFLEDSLVALHRLPGPSDSIENFGGDQRLWRPFVEWRPVMRML